MVNRQKNRISFLFIALFPIVVIGCVSRSEYDKLKEENEILNDKLDLIDQKVDDEANSKLTEGEALIELKDYLKFYCSGCAYQNFNIRKSIGNSFDVSMEKKIMDGEPNRKWNGVLVRITFNSDRTFLVEDLEHTYTHKWGCQ